MTTYVPLRVRTDFSLGRGASTPSAIIQRAGSLAMQSCAITDSVSMGGCYKFSEYALKAGIMPIIGCEFIIHMGDVKGNIVLLARSEAGYGVLNHLLQLSYTPVPKRGGALHIPETPVLEVDESVKSVMASGGVIVLTGSGMEGFARKSIRLDNGKSILALKAMFNASMEEFYVEICRTEGISTRDEASLIAFAQAENLPIVGTTDCWYASETDALAYQMLSFAREERKSHIILDSEKTAENGFFTIENEYEKLHIPDNETFRAWFADLPEAIENTIAISQLCLFVVKKRDPILPPFPCPDNISESDYLRTATSSGLNTLVETYNLDRDSYFARMNMEIEVICRMGFPGYFLIVSEFIQWAKKRDITVGPGRGSGAGSIVAWALGITDVDPIANGLLFERFLNPERVSMPDFDIDFDPDFREEVLDHVRSVYGEDHVCAISAFSSVMAKSALDLAQRCIAISAGGVSVDLGKFGDLKQLRKMIDRVDAPGKCDTLQAYIKAAPEIERLLNDPRKHVLKTIFNAARVVEGLHSHQTTHAAGVVIGGQPLYSLFPVVRDRKKHVLMSAFDMKSVESVGAVKFDFLGLSNLSTLYEVACLSDPSRRAGGRSAAYEPDVERSCEGVYQAIRRGTNEGVFQFSSEGMTNALVRLGPTNFADCAALTALYRPGPMQFLDSFVNRKHGLEKILYPLARYAVSEEVPEATVEDIKSALDAANLTVTFNTLDEFYRLPKDVVEDTLTALVAAGIPLQANPFYPAIGNKIEDLLAETYGYMIYQEQVMGVARIAAGYSYGGADILRRAMGKKIREVMVEQRGIFVEGCARNGILEEDAINLFSDIEKFADYGFNKSHAVAYTIVSYQTMWYKVNRPAFFYSVLLKRSDRKKHYSIMREMYNADSRVVVYPPCVTLSEADPAPCTKAKKKVGDPDDMTAVLLGLGTLSSMATVAPMIAKERSKNGQYKSLVDFWSRTRRFLSSRHYTYLGEAGALDALDPYPETLFEGIANRNRIVTILHWLQKSKKTDSNQFSLFGGNDGYAIPYRIDLSDDGAEEASIDPAEIPEWPDRGRRQFAQLQWSESFADIMSQSAILSTAGFTRVSVLSQLCTLVDCRVLDTIRIPVVVTERADTYPDNMWRYDAEYRRSTVFVGTDVENGYIQLFSKDNVTTEALRVMMDTNKVAAVFGRYQPLGRDHVIYVEKVLFLESYLEELKAYCEARNTTLGQDWVFYINPDVTLEQMNAFVQKHLMPHAIDKTSKMARFGSRIVLQKKDAQLAGMPDRPTRLNQNVLADVWPVVSGALEGRTGCILTPDLEKNLQPFNLPHEVIADIINSDEDGSFFSIESSRPIANPVRRNVVSSVLATRCMDIATCSALMLSEAMWETHSGEHYSGRIRYKQLQEEARERENEAEQTNG